MYSGDIVNFIKLKFSSYIDICYPTFMLKVLPLLIGFVIFLVHAVIDQSEYDYFISGAYHMDLNKMNNDLSEATDQVRSAHGCMINPGQSQLPFVDKVSMIFLSMSLSISPGLYGVLVE